MSIIPQLIKKAAVLGDVDPHLALAIATVESSLNPNVVRFEPNYRWLYKPDSFVKFNNSLDTEVMFQRTSFGVLQVMGANLRELGFRSDWGFIFNPDIQIPLSVAWIKKQLMKHPGSMWDAVSAYNAGSPARLESGAYKNQSYVDKVTKHFNLLKGLQA